MTDDRGGAGDAIVESLAQEELVTLLHKQRRPVVGAPFGVAHSKSALIALLDQDDEWYPWRNLTSAVPSCFSGGRSSSTWNGHRRNPRSS
jgi:hypothetical protein